MGNYVQKLEKRLREHHHDKIIATAALCGCEFEHNSTFSLWSYPGALRGSPSGRLSAGSKMWFNSRLEAAKHFIKARGVQVDYGF